MTGETVAPVPAAVPCWLKPISIFGLFYVTVFNERSHVLTIPLTLAPSPSLMLTESNWPHGRATILASAGTLLVGFVRRVTLPHYHVGYC